MASAKREERAAARALRREGHSLAAIADRLGVAKSSVSVWVRDVARGEGLPAGAQPVEAGVRLPVWTSGAVRRCSRCDLVLPDVCFGRYRDGRQWWCRACFRAYFRERGLVHREQSARAKRRRRDRAREVVAVARAGGCVDCGERDPVVLDFDHVAGKRQAISVLVAEGARLPALREELARCDVVCANCHRHRTAGRSTWIRADPDWRGTLAARASPAARNMRVMLEHSR